MLHGTTSHEASNSGLCHRQAALDKAALGEMRKALGVRAWAGSFGEHGVVTSDLALERGFVLDPPYGGMKEEQRSYQLLGEVGPVVPAAKVREFVQQNLIHVRRAKAHALPNQGSRLRAWASPSAVGTRTCFDVQITTLRERLTDEGSPA